MFSAASAVNRQLSKSCRCTESEYIMTGPLNFRGSPMISKDELISEAISLPVEIRLELVEKLLESLNPSHKDIDELWAIEAEKRVAEIDEGKVETVSGEEVFRKLRERLRK
jgi:putative addiction module component (TIGR02574 family)